MYGFELITMSDCCKNIKGVTLVSKHNIMLNTQINIYKSNYNIDR